MDADACRPVGVDQGKVHSAFVDYVTRPNRSPLFLVGDAAQILAALPDASFDFCMTSPPYWGHRAYAGGGVGLEESYAGYLDGLLGIFAQVRRLLKDTGSFWLNMGDAYHNKNLMGLPWRMALRLTDEQGWTLRNSVIWNKVKGGPDNAVDKLRNVHENLFHFVKNPHGYYYDVDAIRSNPKKAKVVNGAIVSASGVTGVRYKRQIELSAVLSDPEKAEAFKALDELLAQVAAGQLADFRMIIRGQQRATHSDSEVVSGRARELQERGFYFLKYHPFGTKPGDVWDILPEDTQKREGHFAPYPEDLCRLPIVATCPSEGLVLDPMCGTGTTMFVAHQLGRKSVGVDICSDYVGAARKRCRALL
jgi:DNA modification methylase